MEERKSRYELWLEEQEKSKEKPCSKCGKIKPLADYHKGDGVGGRRAQCKSCIGFSSRKYKGRIDRFWKYYHSHYRRVGDCLEWTGARHSDGQPVCQWEGRQTRVRRVVYKLAIGELTDEDVVLVTCKNKLCVRHAHLMKKPKEDALMLAWNSAATGDRNGARTHPERMVPFDPRFQVRGEKHGQAKITEDDVRAIRRLYADGGITQREIAAQFRISQTHVCQIVRRKNWDHIE